MSTEALAATIAALLIGIVVVFQVALVAGAPWGAAAWGGQHPGRLPGRLRVASAISAIVLVALAFLVLTAAGLVDTPPPVEPWLLPATWGATGYFVIGGLVNLISRSRVERLWAPVSVVIAICFAIVAMT
jgi:hypothetical protein